MNVDQLRVGTSVSAYLEESKVGMGERYFLLTAIGRKWVTLFYPPTLQTLKLTRKALGTIRRFSVLPSIPRRYWRKLIRDKMETFDKYSLQYSKVAAELALKVLRASRDGTHTAAAARDMAGT